jgi:hypothetical protein
LHITSFIDEHSSELTAGGQQFRDDLLHDKAESPEEHRGTWEKGDIVLTIEAASIVVSGANWDEANGAFQIGGVSGVSGYYHYWYFNDNTEAFGLDCELIGQNLWIDDRSGPVELQGTWSRD